MGAVNTFGAFSGIALLGIVFVLIVAFLIALIMLADWEKFKKMKNLLGWVIRTFDYFLYGLITVIVIGIPLGLLYLGGTAVESNPEILYWIGGIIGGFFAISGVGYLLKPFYSRIRQNIERSMPKNPEEAPVEPQAGGEATESDLAKEWGIR